MLGGTGFLAGEDGGMSVMSSCATWVVVRELLSQPGWKLSLPEAAGAEAGRYACDNCNVELRRFCGWDLDHVVVWR